MSHKPPIRKPSLDHPVIRAVIDFVCSEIDVDPLELHGTSREHKVALARHVVWIALYSTGIYTVTELGRLFLYNHSSVIHAINTITTRIDKPIDREARWLTKIVERARELAMQAVQMQALACPERDLLQIPVYSVDLDETDNLMMADSSVRFFGGWMVRLGKDLDVTKFPKKIIPLLEREKDARFIWVTPTSFRKVSETSTGSGTKTDTTRRVPATSEVREKAVTISPMIPPKPVPIPVGTTQITPE